jgi:hypothetical protein
MLSFYISVAPGMENIEGSLVFVVTSFVSTSAMMEKKKIGQK